MPSFKAANLLSNVAYFTMNSSKMCNIGIQLTKSQRQYHLLRNHIQNLFLESSLSYSSDSTMTIKDVKTKIRELMEVRHGFNPIPPNRTHLLKYLPQSQDELPPRSMKDSFDSVIIPLGSSPSLQEKYMTLLGSVRKGRLLEDMDLFAVWICLKYIYNPKVSENQPTPYTLVTANVDQISFKDWSTKVTDDMRISGQVQWVGKSSMEVCVWLESFILGEWKLFTKAYFIMVARNSTNTGPAFVNKFQPAGPDEEATFLESEKRAMRRKLEKESSLLKRQPTVEEQTLIYKMFMKTVDFTDPTFNRRALPSGSIWMDSTKITNMLFPHPEHRNAHNTVFGGLLMRLSSELSWVVAYTYAKHRPILRHISDITFKSPVSINSFVKMSSQVAYTRLNFAEIVVYCELLDILTNKMVTSNVFYYTYECTQILPEVLPQTYLESMMWLDGRRHFLEAMEYHI